LIDREKVLKGLRACKFNMCISTMNCPGHSFVQGDTGELVYACPYGHLAYCLSELVGDALQILDQPAMILSYEEIEALPELAVVWEEVRVVWEEAVKNYPGLIPEDEAVDVSIAPVEKQGRKLCGSGMDTTIRPDMLDEDRGTQVRYWSARPSDEQREAAPWG